MLRFLTRPKAITRITFQPAQPAADRHGMAVVVIVRNEERHIAEWARFHLLAGVRQIIVYDNGCTDRTLDRLREAVPAGQLLILPWKQKLSGKGAEIHNQVLAYAHATSNFGSAFRWMTYIDVDEFLVPVRNATLTAALAGLEGCACISLPWHMFGRSGHVEPPDGGVVGNYLFRNPDPMSKEAGLCNFKMIVDPCRVTAIKVHAIETDGSTDTCNDRGIRFRLRDRTDRSFYSAERIQLNHYYTRSDSELKAKIVRGPNLTTPENDHVRRVMRKVAAIEADQIADHVARDFLERAGSRSSP